MFLENLMVFVFDISILEGLQSKQYSHVFLVKLKNENSNSLLVKSFNP